MAAYAEGLNIIRGIAAQGGPRSRRRDDAAARPAVLQLRHRRRRGRGRWRRGSVIGSWLLDLTAAALHADPKLEASPAGSPTRARAAGRASRRSRRACRPRCSPPLSTAASPPRARPTSPYKVESASASSSADTTRRSPTGGTIEAPPRDRPRPRSGRRCRSTTPDRRRPPARAVRRGPGPREALTVHRRRPGARLLQAPITR